MNADNRAYTDHKLKKPLKGLSLNHLNKFRNLRQPKISY